MATKDKQPKQDKFDEIESFLAKTYGHDGDPNNIPRPNFYRTGVPSIDHALGGGTGELGGFPAGHMTEIYGKEAVGKTTLVYRAIAHAQKVQPEKIHLILDYEHTTDSKYIQACGVEFNKTKLRIMRPKTMEEGIAILYIFLKSGRLGICCIDSFAAMNPGTELARMQDDMAKMGVATKAKLMASVCRLLVPELAGTQSAVIFINHEIANIVASPYQGGYNPPTTTPGGNSLKYYSSMRIQLSFKGMITEEGQTLDGKDVKHGVGKKIQAYVEKFKFGSPGQRVDYLIRAGEGIDMLTPLISMGTAAKLIKKEGGGYFTLACPGLDPVRVRGADALRAYFKATPESVSALSAALDGHGASDALDNDLVSLMDDDIDVIDA